MVAYDFTLLLLTIHLRLRFEHHIFSQNQKQIYIQAYFVSGQIRTLPINFRKIRCDPSVDNRN